MFLCRISFNYGNYDLFSTRVCNIWDETFHLLHLEVNYVWDITWCTLIFQVDTTSTGNSGADVRLLVPSMSLDLRWSSMSVPPPSISDANCSLLNKKSVLQTKYRPLFIKKQTKYRPLLLKIQTKIGNVIAKSVNLRRGVLCYKRLFKGFTLTSSQ